MNVERMLYLADQLENPTDPKLKYVRFNMRDYTSTVQNPEKAAICGTAACIGGHACILFNASRMSFVPAMEVLGLTYSQAQFLFYNGNNYVSETWAGSLSRITREEAVAAIRKMVKEHVDESIAALDLVEEGVPVAVCD